MYYAVMYKIWSENCILINPRSILNPLNYHSVVQAICVGFVLYTLNAFNETAIVPDFFEEWLDCFHYCKQNGIKH